MTTTVHTAPGQLTRPDPSQMSTNYQQMQEKWHLPAALLGGTRAMRKQRTRYLPMDDKESDKAYNARLERSTLLNAYGRTCNAMTGKVFSKPIVLKDDMPPQLIALAEDIDAEGRKLNVFAESVFQDAIAFGISHILIDMPKSTKANPTLADDIREKRRPYWVHIKHDQLIGYRSRRVGASRILTAIRIRENEMEEDGDYGEKEVERVREITETTWSLTQRNSDTGNWELVDSGPNTLGIVPLVTYYTKRVGFQLADPPLENLAWKNVEHWQSASDQRHILHVARAPILFSSGLGDDDDLIVGPNRHIRGPVDSKLVYVEHTGAAIDAGNRDLDKIEDHMRLMGLELLMPMNGGGQTATAKSLDYADVNSPLQFMALNFQDALDLAFWYTAKWLMLPAAGHTKVNTDFGITLRDAADVQGLIQARIAGEISREAFWTELKRRGILHEDFDIKKEAALLEKEEEEAMVKAMEAMQNRTNGPPGTGVGGGKLPGAAPGGVPGVGSDVKKDEVA